jgi:hypothetical protein
MRYFVAWTPVVIVLGTAVLLSSAYLALIALMIVAVVALPALAFAIVAVPYLLSRSLSRRLREHAATRTPRALSTGHQGTGAR